MKYNCDHLTDRIVNLQKNDFAFLKIRYILLRLCRFSRNKIHNIKRYLDNTQRPQNYVIHRENAIDLPESFRKEKQKLQLTVQG